MSTTKWWRISSSEFQVNEIALAARSESNDLHATMTTLWHVLAYAVALSYMATLRESLFVTLAPETLPFVLIMTIMVLAARTLRALCRLTRGHIGASLSETTDGGVGIELHLLSQAVLLLLPALELQSLVTPSSASTVVLLAEFVAHLTTALPSPELATLLVARVKVATDDALIELGTGDVAETCDSLLVQVVFDEGESARRPNRSQLEFSRACGASVRRTSDGGQDP